MSIRGKVAARLPPHATAIDRRNRHQIAPTAGSLRISHLYRYAGCKIRLHTEAAAAAPGVATIWRSSPMTRCWPSARTRWQLLPARVTPTEARADNTEIWLRELKDGSRAAGLFNRGEQATDIALNPAELELAGQWKARDLWQHKDLGTSDAKLTLPIPPHGSALLRLYPVKE